ncbi:MULTISPECIES: phosphoglucomutase (alpha-D-glucose-1,6-bisphosphate-dependent) [Gammaproteobacteria]|uniref:phosphoglucomutase (alpha-D-glucose-1,6-bisphosphate-dependent) n=1 Tax=Gammaproteobacteria TaxID=1236 RepID=UPI000DCF7A83|nr:MULTISPECIES: phosphoglucomutase (alpha-D-glucose-1,6-bisphosphate-dependent) [Gammaproteobacteria]RTE87030.1 alpha-D-glucose phosphate-specific phosphoglucomutase [Aliidiomarina sp. B3213]TCZ93180.1 alpha-D-glucose phosphate-specific phosphoglucomutase [Lysobacter sp. N42]
MTIHERAGQQATQQDLVHIPALMAAYYVNEPDPRDPQQKVSFGTSGHRGSSLKKSFNEAHILAVCQAICGYREEQGIKGPLLLGKDTHALSEAAFITALEVFIANGITVHVQQDLGYTPTPVISHQILKWNKEHPNQLADGVVITPSHNPPADGGIKYNPSHGGPADSKETRVIEKYANAIMSSGLSGVNAVDYDEALHAKKLKRCDWVASYVNALADVVDIEAIRKAKVRIGVNAMGGAGIEYWRAIAEHYELDISLINDHVDPTFSFMSLDKDGQIRMDCSSPFAMSSMVALKDSFDLAIGNDPDYDRHGIVTQDGLMNPNHYLAVSIDYLLSHRNWGQKAKVGKTIVSSAIIDRVVAARESQLFETPVGFKWFAEGMFAGEIGFAGEESAGASFLDFSGQPFSTDKDGIILGLLAAEILAVTGKSPSQYYQELEQQHGTAFYKRLDVKASHEDMESFKELAHKPFKLTNLADEPVENVLTTAPGNGATFGGVKVVTANGWFAVRPSGTEPVYKIYAESLKSEAHLEQILSEASQTVIEWLARQA